MRVKLKKVIFDTRIDKDISYKSIIWSNCTKMLAMGFSLKKGDYWTINDEPNPPFFSAEWRTKNEKSERTGIYIGRLGLVYIDMKEEKK